MKLLRQKHGSPRNLRERGQVLAEFAVIATVFFLFLFGIFDFARMFQTWITVQHSARDAARFAITGLNTCEGTTGRSACIDWTAENGTLGLSHGGVGSSRVSVSYKYWDYPGYGGAGKTGAGGPCDAIEVVVVYQHHFITPLVKPIMGALGADPIALKGVQRMTNEPWGNCVDVVSTTRVPGGRPPPDTPTPASTSLPT